MTDQQTLPTFAELQEGVLFQVYQSWRCFIGYFISIVLSVGLIFLIDSITGPILNIPYLGAISLRWLSILPVAIIAELARRYHNELYVFEKNQVRQISGRLSLSYKVPVVKYIDIRAIGVDQSILGRLLDYGTVMIGTAAKEGNEVVMHGVRSPRRLAEQVDELRSESERSLRRIPQNGSR